MSSLDAAQWKLLRWEFVDPGSLLYELSAQADGEVTTLASLRWGRREAIAQSSGEAWAFRHRGFWAQRVHARPLTSQQVVDNGLITVTRTWRLYWRWSLGQARWCQWRRVRPNAPDWLCEDQAGAALLWMEVEPKSKLALEATARLEVSEEGRGQPRLALVMALGWYLALLVRLNEQAKRESNPY
jgi:hypothetical protein